MLYQDHMGEGFLAIAVSSGGDSDDQLAVFVDQTGISFPLVRDEGTKSQFSWPPSISPYPRQALIGRDGTVAYTASEHELAALENALLAALAEPAP